MINWECCEVSVRISHLRVCEAPPRNAPHQELRDVIFPCNISPLLRTYSRNTSDHFEVQG